MKDNKKINRRNFLQMGAFATAGIGFKFGIEDEQKTEKDKVDSDKILNYHPKMHYRRLGNTDILLSVLSLGGSGLERSIAHYAIDRGVNLIHIASNYKGGNSIIELGSVLKTRRDKVYIAMKDSFYKGSIDDINGPLKTMNTDYVDFIMFNRHQASGVTESRIPELFEKWKAQGKVRFAGLTSHDDVKECVAAGINSNTFSIIQPAIPQPGYELLQEEINQAHKKGVGIMAMKTMKGIRDDDLQLAQLKKLLKNPAITTVNKGINNFEMFDSYLKAIQGSLSSREDFELYKYAQKNRDNNCMMCGECKRACPRNIEIPAILRCLDYYHYQLHDTELAASTYHSIPAARRFVSYCGDCRECEKVCPNGIRIAERLGQTGVLA